MAGIRVYHYEGYVDFPYADDWTVSWKKVLEIWDGKSLAGTFIQWSYVVNLAEIKDDNN